VVSLLAWRPTDIPVVAMWAPFSILLRAHALDELGYHSQATEQYVDAMHNAQHVDQLLRGGAWLGLCQKIRARLL
jgi:hypothetical protein